MMKPVLFIKNITLEGPGTMGPFLRERNIPFVIHDLFAGDGLPDSPDAFGAIVVLGGPMSIYEEEKYPFLAEEKSFLRRCAELNQPMLGICLGAQLLADILGAKVAKNEVSEIGWMDVELTSDGEISPLFSGFPKSFPVFQWHGDTFTMPSKAYWLARSLLCFHQAFSVEETIFGLQFHIEVDAETAVQWAEYYLNDLPVQEKGSALLLKNNPDRTRTANVASLGPVLYGNFFETIAGYNCSKKN